MCRRRRAFEVRAQEGQPAPPDPAAPNLVSPSTAAQEGVVTRDDETMEQEEPESKRQRTVAGLPVCSLLLPVDEIPVSYVATHEIDERPVFTTRRVNCWLHIW